MKNINISKVIDIIDTLQALIDYNSITLPKHEEDEINKIIDDVSNKVDRIDEIHMDGY